MRWLVEVTSVGQAGTKSITVEADSWHKALENARRQRGEEPHLSGFSIELLENGCRAVDPLSRLRYTVTPSAANATLSPGISSAGVDQAPAGSGVAALQAKPFHVAFKREHDPTDAVPLTYREYVLAVPPGTTESSAEDLVRRYLQTVRTALVNSPAGKVVNVAVFEAPFDERQGKRPLLTLNWKDWNAEPSIKYPRRAQDPGQGRLDRGADRSSLAQFAGSPAGAAANSRVATPSRPVSEPAVSPVEPALGPPAKAPVSPRVAAFPRPAGESAASSPIEPPPVLPAEPTVGPPPAVLPSPADPSDGASGSALLSAGASDRRPRLSAEELLAELFESMHELQFARDPVSGGDFCLSIAMGTIPATAGIVHLYDIARREFLVSSAAGASVESWRHRRHPESDPVLSRAMRMRGALVIADIGAADFALPPRYTELGGVRSIVISRAALGGRFLGAIELIDPLDGLPFTATEGNALTYIAEQFAEFVASRGAVIDPAAPLGSNRGR